jgi:CheY-like chemotaxis protein
VITDLRMPYIDGLDIIDFIRKRHKESLIIVLRLGAYDHIKRFGPDLFKMTPAAWMKSFNHVLN